MPDDTDPARTPELWVVKIGIFVGSFIPGYRHGGPIRSLDALTRVEKQDVRFCVITSDRDLGDVQRYSIARPGRWVNLTSRRVLYVNTRSLWDSFIAIRKVRDENLDVYYFNSLWNPAFTLLPLMLMCMGILPRRPVVLAPRGEVLREAMASRSRKKMLMLPVVNAMLKILRATFHCTFDEEAQAVRRLFPQAPIIMIGDSFEASQREDPLTSLERQSSKTGLRLLYLSRINPHKNLLGCLKSLQQVNQQIEFRVVGPRDDENYYQKCLSLAEKLPENIEVTFLGGVSRDSTEQQMLWSDVFIIPTKSENFGHVIREALALGCIVVTSKTTPWEALLNEVGCSPIAWYDTAGYSRRLEELCAMSQIERNEISRHVSRAYQAWENKNKGSGLDLVVQLARLADAGEP
jgi:glycosyltransferase involved in cell wall biosynthesis